MYIKTDWQAGVTPLSEANLDHLETQYDEGKTDLDAHEINAAGSGKHRWTAEKLLKGQGAGADPVEVAMTKDATREFSVNPYGHSSKNFSDFDSLGVLMDAVEVVYFQFKCPHDYTTLTECKIIFASFSGGNIDWTANTTFAAIGEAYNTHTDSATADGVSLAGNLLYAIDISAAFTGLTADDDVHVEFRLDAITSGNIRVRELYFKYE